MQASELVLVVTDEDLIQAPDMPVASLRPPQPSKEEAGTGTKQVNFQCPLDLKAYVTEAAHTRHSSQAQVIIQALELDRDLAVKLASHQEGLSTFAGHQRLDLGTDLAEVIAELVIRGLEHRKK